MRRAWLLALASCVWACSEEVPDPPRDAATRGGGGDATFTPSDAGERPEVDSGERPDADPTDAETADAGFPSVVEVTVTPTVADLLSIDGSHPTQRFSVSARYTDGSTIAVVNPAFTVEPVLLGTISSTTGVFTADGRFGGEGRVIAAFEGATGFARIRIRLEQTVLVSGTSTTVPGLFENQPVADPMREADVAYPLDGAVMPQNVPPAEVQWLRAAPGDAFRIELSKPNVTVLAYYAASAGRVTSWVVDPAAWRRIAQSESQEWAEIRVDRWIAATGDVILGTPVRVRFPRAAMLGSIYYWDIARGRIVRINDGTATRDEFMPHPQLGCVGCHSVSTNGRYMAGRLGPGDNIAAVYDLTQDLTTNPPPTLFTVTSTTIRWWFSSWNPAGTRLVVSQGESDPANRALTFVDPFRGRVIQPAMGEMPTGRVTHPAWSPDGTEIAFVNNANDWGGANSTGDIWVVPLTGPDTLGAPRMVMTGTTPQGLPMGAAANYPTWSPDSGVIVFAHGNSSRSETGWSALYLMKRDGSGLVRLDNASGGPGGIYSYQPRFSPFSQDGYFWLSHLSRRDYGNSEAGTRGTLRQQIWVSAIKVNPASGEDPSEVPFWLPGQNTQSLNISAYWAPRACRGDGEGCGVDAECCSRDCDPDEMGGNVCSPISGRCSGLGEPCANHEQCCDQVLCIDGTCGGI